MGRKLISLEIRGEIAGWGEDCRWLWADKCQETLFIHQLMKLKIIGDSNL